jgi:hypothetical protein
MTESEAVLIQKIVAYSAVTSAVMLAVLYFLIGLINWAILFPLRELVEDWQWKRQGIRDHIDTQSEPRRS